MNIFESINKVMAQIGAIGKNSKNSSQGFMYRGVDAVMNALSPALIDNKVFVVPEVLDQSREERINAKGTTLIYSVCKVKYTFFAEDGTSISATVIGEGMDSGDKATNKAMSIAFKYACFQVFCIPTEEMVDPDAECHEVQPKGKEVTPLYITDEQKAKIMAEVNRTGVSPDTICSMYKVKSLDVLPASYAEGLLKKLGNTPSIEAK